MRRLISLIGFLMLSYLTLWLFGASLIETVRNHPWLSIVKGFIILGLVYELFAERKQLAVLKGVALNREAVWKFLAVFFGAIVTFVISVHCGCGAVVASGAVGLFGAVFIRRYAVPLFCGSFAGMASSAVLVSMPSVVLAGFIAGIFFVASEEVLNGFGGKLGTIAFGGCVGASMLIRSPLLADAIPCWEVGRLIVLYSVVGAVITYVISIRLKTGPVAASALIGLIAGLLMPVLYGRHLGETLAVMIFCASFAGMSGAARMPSEIPVVLAGVFCGLVFMYSSPHLCGAGGKLGTIAFGSVIAVRGLMDIASQTGLAACLRKKGCLRDLPESVHGG